MPDDDFPCEAIREAGYSFVFSGQRTYNGVAILSREPAEQVVKDLPDWEDPQRRVLAAQIGDIRVINFYIPNGESITSDKYQYKLNWLNKMDNFLQQEARQYKKIVVLGDFNIAPAAIDVHDPAGWEGQVICTEPERAAFQQMLKIGLVDCFRHHNPTEQAYSWWDYRMNAFKRNLGLRIDHILASEAMVAGSVGCYIDKAVRSQERPSDHAPVVAQFTLN